MIASLLLRRTTSLSLSSSYAAAATAVTRLSNTAPIFLVSTTTRRSTFSFAGPKALNEILELDLLADKTGPEISDMWLSYHESKVHVFGTCLDGKDGKVILNRAVKCPFFVQPVFRDDGFFMLISQFQEPRNFLMAYLEDYKMDPHSATPLLTFSVFDDLSASKDMSLVRCDILNPNIQDDEARKVVQSVLDNYRNEDEFGAVKAFNEKPNAFDIDDYVSRMNDRWKTEPPSVFPPSERV